MESVGKARSRLRRTQERRLAKTTLIRPQYAPGFRCIGPACEDSCCIGWRVDVDARTYEKYQTVPAGGLRNDLDTQIVRMEEEKPGIPPTPFARIKMPPSLACPFLGTDLLCRIQVEHGPEYLSHVCATFPRAVNVIDGMEDRTLTLSCPEAARLVLLNPNLLYGPEPVHTFNWDDNPQTNPSLPTTPLRTHFWTVREFQVGLIRNRKYPLWQRLFLLGSFARRLDALVSGGMERSFPTLLKEFSAAIASNSLRSHMETIPADLMLQLDMVMQLVKLRIVEGQLQPRLSETLNAFADGVGFRSQSTLEGQSAQYGLAYKLYYAPFFLHHPLILENLLTNMIFRRLFPFGLKLFDVQAVPEPAREFALLATEFALIKGVLIGVAGFYRETFTTEHVVKTVQVMCKYFEHNTTFLAKAHELLVARQLDDARGLAMLLRN